MVYAIETIQRIETSVNSIISYDLKFDGLLGLLTMLAIFPVVWNLHRQEQVNSIERKLLFLSFCMTLFFAIRFLFEFFSLKFLSGILYATGIVMLLATALFFETLLRRHYPLWFKIYLVLGSLVFSILSLFELMGGNRTLLMSLGGYILSCQLTILFLGFTRKRKDYTRVENSIINISLVALIFIGPFFISDISIFHIGGLNLGELGALIFSYLSLHERSLTKGSTYPLMRLLKSVIISAIALAPLTFLISNQELWFWGRAFILVLGANLSMRIMVALRQQGARTEMGEFLEVLAHSSRRTALQFLFSFREFYKKVDVKIMRKPELSNYHLDSIDQYFERYDIVFLSRDSIQAFKNQETPPASHDLDVLDEVEDLLHTYEMTHLLRFGKKDVYYMLICAPLIHYENTIELQARTLASTVDLIESNDSGLNHA
jgi:hypothetical protein